MRHINNNLIALMIILVTIASLSINLFQLHQIDEITGKAVNNATVSIRLIHPPTINSTDCAKVLWGSFDGRMRPYECNVSLSNKDNLSLSFFSDDVYGNVSKIDNHNLRIHLEGNISKEGIRMPDNITFNLGMKDISNLTFHDTLFFNMSYNSQVLLTQRFPDNYTNELELEEGLTTYHHSLDDHFKDIDDFLLDYSYTTQDAFCSLIDIDIQAESHLLTFTPDTGSGSIDGECNMRFHAKNPYNFTNRTNVFKIKVNVRSEEQDQGGGGGGAGSGSGGISANTDRYDPQQDCVMINVNCSEWSECRYVKPIDGSWPNKIDRLWTPFDGPFSVESYDRLHDGISDRSCTWMTNCPGEMGPAQNRICDYKPTCEDNTRNCHEFCYKEKCQNISDLKLVCETGIDCGGPCDPCPTCDDFIQNQGETGIDCGGPCDPCPTCTDKIKNCHKTENKTILCEVGIDCGGPCNPCPTCNDSIMNCHRLDNGSILCEEGVDCGGPCGPCLMDQPVPITESNWLYIILIILLGITITGLIVKYIGPVVISYYFRRYMAKVKRAIEKRRTVSDKTYVQNLMKQVDYLSNDFDKLTTKEAKKEGDNMITAAQATGYNIDRYSVSFDNDYADVLGDNNVRTINYAMYMSNISHGQRILKELMNQGIKPNYKICKRSSTVKWDDRWERDPNATYERVQGQTIARTVEYIISFYPKNEEETRKTLKVLETYGKGKGYKTEDSWDVPDIRVTGNDPLTDFERCVLNVKSVAGQKLMVLTKNRPMPGFKSTQLWINSGLSRFIR